MIYLSMLAELVYDPHNKILFVRWLEGVDMNSANIRQHIDLVNQITGKDLYCAIIDAKNHIINGPDSIELSVVDSHFTNRKATLFYNAGLANHLTIEFFKIKHHPGMIIKTMNSKKHAVEWWTNLRTTWS